MIVTDITDMDKKRKKVYLDGEYAFALYNSEIYRYNPVSYTHLTLPTKA